MRRNVFLLSGILAIILGIVETVKQGDPFIGALLIAYGARDILEWRSVRLASSTSTDSELDVSALNEADRAESLALWDKALAGYDAVDDAIEHITDPELKGVLGRTQVQADRILDYIEAHPETISLARKYIETYQSRAANLATEYATLERSQLSTERIAALKERLKTTLGDFEAAYAVEFERILSSSLLSTEAEIDVVEQVMEADSVRERASVHRAKAAREDYTHTDRTGLLCKVRDRLESLFARTGSYSVIPSHEQGRVIGQKLTAGVLAIFLGSIGAHKFFLGKTKQAICYILFCWTFIPGLIGFIEGIRYLFMPLDDYYKKVYR